MNEIGTELEVLLERSRDLGFLGPGEIGPQIVHARGFLPAIEGARNVLDLGSGGGLPGLVLAMERPQIEFVLLDANKRRCAFLEAAVLRLGIAGRVSVVNGRAEEAARSLDLRGAFDVVVSRSFGPPAVTAECAAGFLKGVGSVLAVSEPRESPIGRWPTEQLMELGLAPGKLVHGDLGDIQILQMVSPCPNRYPRRVGIPSKRPLF